MSASIDDEVTEEGEDVRSVLAGWLNDYSEGRCELEDMQESFLAVCRTEPDAPWDALALLDQYTRRGRITSDLAQSLKVQVKQIVFGDKAALGVSRAPPPVGDRNRDGSRDRNTADDTFDLDSDDSAAVRAEEVEPPPPPSIKTEPPRWRKITAERDAESTRPGTAFIDRTTLRREPAPAASLARREPAVQPMASGGAGRVLRERYELSTMLGADHSGSVYRATDRRRAHLSETARSVAVKVLSADYAANPHALAALEREFHLAQSLSHPNIANVFDLDRDGETYFVVMERLEGELLSSVLRDLRGRPMRREHALAIIGGVGAALAYAHARDVVHGDVAPENVMLTRPGEVRVLNFGFSRSRPLDLHTAAAPDEAAAPSPAYASVERVNGSPPEPADDVYSLACIAYELLTGRHPFGGRAALVARTRGRRPPRVRGLNRRAQQALRRALSWRRADRRISVVELVRSLGCEPAGAVVVHPDDVIAPERSHARWLKASGWLLALLAAGGGLFYFAPQVREQIAAVNVWATEFVKERSTAMISGGVPTPAAPEPAATAESESDASEGSPPESVAPGSEEQTAAAADEPEPAPDERTARAQTQAPAPASTAPRQTAASAQPPTIQFAQDTYVTTEQDGSVRVLVRRSGDAGRAVTFTWALRGNSAIAGEDFAAIGPGVERMGAGVRELAITIPLVSDAITENTEIFLVELDAGEGASLGERSYATVIIVDDD